MRNTIIPYLLVSLLASASLPLNAAESHASPVIAASAEVSSKLDLNTADAASLQSTMMGIGKAKAQAIVDYREAHGAFTSVDELLEVKGIGQALLERNRDRLSIGN
ncbi:ComEA family DNA-binding protein [Pseudomonas parasichuanensis]|uniref:ComEA family DNA-binding protein n=1 Tax=Pseudomonas parasichuanensis TaxID=2892329 RepID=UPI001F1DC004|nr:ComEA family DNA-binding protein [Pseudomonas parasichuanensis]